MFNVEKELTRFSPMKELDILEDAGQTVDSDGLRKVVQLYNQALDSLKLKSEDIAAIELKKAISIYPDFIEAKILLALCYIVRNQFDKAEELLLDITDSDHAIAKAHQYLQYIDLVHHKKTARKDGILSKKAPVNIKINVAKFHIGFIKSSLIFIVGILVTYLFLYNSFGNSGKHSAVNTSGINEIKETYQKKIDSYSSELTATQSNIQKLEQQLSEQDDQLIYLENIKKILMAEKLHNNNEKDKAMELILSLKEVQFQGVEKEKYDLLYKEIIPQVAREYYIKAYNLYNGKKYNEAIQPFNMCIQLELKESDEYLYSLYFGAKSYQAIGDKLNAASYYNQVIHLFPNSKYAEYSKNWLKELNSN
ncbi:tetratricopeptide repeat protein [Petroclostridium sp. X23]|uniref:tetratricopeptide repeat protein n=1 Tax=Petroclostridium sp. X23 TaxID=3045146 RepID=UPI0024AE6FDB|nr:tetratricopeptide repeat protein [Petroclostridium sp. X23]WHH60449.1 tetratricopeptide repeat protein [Petroclostridium sp. X23]